MTEEDLEQSLIQAYRESQTHTALEDHSLRLRKTRELLLAHPPPDRSGGLVLVVAPDAEPYWVALQDRTTVGRDPAADLTLAHPWVSGIHCILRQDGHDWWVEDPGSTNGIKVNGTRRQAYLLREGDAVELGQHILIFIVGAEA